MLQDGLQIEVYLKIAEFLTIFLYADHIMRSWLIIVDMRRTKFTRVMSKALKFAYRN